MSFICLSHFPQTARPHSSSSHGRFGSELASLWEGVRPSEASPSRARSALGGTVAGTLLNVQAQSLSSCRARQGHFHTPPTPVKHVFVHLHKFRVNYQELRTGRHNISSETAPGPSGWCWPGHSAGRLRSLLSLCPCRTLTRRAIYFYNPQGSLWGSVSDLEAAEGVKRKPEFG